MPYLSSAADGEPDQRRTRDRRLRHPHPARRRQPRRRRGRRDRRRRPQRRRQDDAAAGADRRPATPDSGPGHPHLGSVGRLPATRPTTSPRGSTVRDVIVDGRADHIWAADAETGSVVEHLLTDVDLDARGDRPQRWRAPPGRAGGGSARRARRAGARRADQPSRRRGDRVAGRPPVQPTVEGARRGQPRPVVPRRGLHADVGGARRHRRRLRRRLRGLRPGAGRADADWPRVPRLVAET